MKKLYLGDFREGCVSRVRLWELLEANEEMKSKLDVNYLQLLEKIEQLEEDFHLKKPINKELERLIDNTEADIETHRDNLGQRNVQYSTRLTDDLLRTLRTNQVLVLSGNSGAGKSFQAFQLLSLISQSYDHKPVIIRDFDDTKHVISSEEPLCILVDDIFGKFTLNQDELAKWNHSINTFISQIKRKRFLLLITLNSVREKQCLKENAHKIIKKYSRNLDEDGLTQEEKKQMALQCVGSAGVQLIKELEAEKLLPLGFPLCCQLAKDNATFNQLMTEPLQDIIEKMESSCFIPLLMTLLTNEQFDESCLIQDENACMANCFEKIKKELRSDKINRLDILSKAESMIGSYLLQTTPHTFKFIHHAVLEATFKAAIYKHLVGLLIEYCHLGILLNLTDLLKGHLTKQRMETLLKRISTGNVSVKQLAQCTLWKDEQFHDQALQYFDSKLDFFLTSDGTGESLFVAFSGLGFSLLLTKILNRKYKLQTKDIENQTELALLEACSHGHLKCVDILLNQHGTCVRDEHMFRCIQSGNVELFDYLTTKGGSIKATNERQRKNILHEACIQKKINMVRKVISCNTHNTTDMSYLFNMQMTETAETPLCLAAKYCDVETVKCLIDTGGSAFITDSTGRNILHLALIHGFGDVITFIEQQYPQMISELSDKEETTVMFAAQRGSLQHLQSYVGLGVDPYAVTTDGINMLHLAALYGRKDVVDYILKTYPTMTRQTCVMQKTAAHYAASGGYLDCLKTLIDHGIDPLSICYSKRTLLQYAARFAHSETVEYLCKKYPQLIQTQDTYQCNAAHAAVYGGDIHCLKTLINYGIDPLYRTHSQETPCHVAARKRHHKIVEYLCKSYPDILKLTDNNQYNAAHAAAFGGDINCLKTLIQHGIDPLSRCSKGKTLLHVAARRRNHETVEYLCKVYPRMLKLIDNNQYNAGHYAAMGGDVGCLKTLINYGIDPLSRTSTQQTLLHLAAWHRHHESVEYICNAYPQIIKLTNTDEYNAGHYAAIGGDLDCLKTLINHGIDPLSRTSTQETLLHLAAWYRRHESVEYICNAYPQIIQLTDKTNYNAGHYAAMGGDVDCLKTLINHGMDPLSRTSTQQTLLHLAAWHGRHESVEYICNAYQQMIQLTNTTNYNAGHFAAMGGDVDCLKTLINHGMDPLSRTSTQQTLLHLAAWHGRHESVEYICNAYPQIIQLTNTDEYNAGHYAAKGGALDCLKTLINHGIDQLSRTSTQQTLLHLAAWYKHRESVEYICKVYPHIIQLTDNNRNNAAHFAAIGGDLDCFKTLIQHGIDPLTRTTTQGTVLHYAAECGHPETVEHLCIAYPHILKLTCNNQYNAAHCATVGGDIGCLKTLLDHGIDPLSRTSTLESMLHIAAACKHSEIVDYLCKAYPHIIQLTDVDLDNAAHVAAQSGDTECLRTLIQHGIDPLSRTSTQRTLLHVAAWHKHVETVEYLCKAFPHLIQLTDNKQYNAAHAAAQSGDIECLKILIQHGIDPLSRTFTQQTLLHVAAGNKHPKTVEYLCKAFPRIIHLTANNEYNAAHVAALSGDIESLKTLIQHGIDPLSRTSTQKTLLNVATFHQNTKIVKYLKQFHT